MQTTALIFCKEEEAVVGERTCEFRRFFFSKEVCALTALAQQKNRHKWMEPSTQRK